MAKQSYFVLPTVKPGDSISWSSLSRDSEIVAHEWQPQASAVTYDGYLPGSRLVRVTYQGIPFTPIPYCTFGDYDNSTAVERSNHRVMLARFPWLVSVTGDYGSQMLGYLGKRETQNPDLIEAIDALEAYSIADESDESELESEMEFEAWKDYGRRDFTTELKSVLDTIDADHEHDLDVDDLDERIKSLKLVALHSPYEYTDLVDVWRDGCDAYNVNGGNGYQIECGGSVHFYTRQWCECAAAEPKQTSYGSRTTFEMRDSLLKLARACRSES